MIYLASPYSHPNPVIREQRFHDACRAAASLIQSGQAVFSPIVYGHPLVTYGLPTEWSFWEAHDRLHLERCEELVVLMLAGWRRSAGVEAEIRIARELGKPVRYLSQQDATCPPTLAYGAEESPR